MNRGIVVAEYSSFAIIPAKYRRRGWTLSQSTEPQANNWRCRHRVALDLVLTIPIVE